jgi:hypothetical protein
MMREQLLDDVVARRFLLGQLPPEEQGRIEELAFEDRNTFAFLEAVENDLIDEFIQGDLTADEEQSFKSHFLFLPGRLHNLKISRLLQRHLNKVAPVPEKQRFSFLAWFKLQNLWRKFAMAAAVIAVVVFAVWLVLRFLEAKKPVTIQAGPDKPVAIPSPSFKISPSQVPTSSPAHVENKPKSVMPEKHRKSAYYAVLFPSASPRSAGVQQLKLAPDNESMTIELALITQRSFRTYKATLQNEQELELYLWPDLKAERLTSGKAVKIDVPKGLLKPQQFYRIVVSGVPSRGDAEEIARYPFEVKE